MPKIKIIHLFLGVVLSGIVSAAPPAKTVNPMIFADVPDMSMVRVGNAYYMSSTTMHMTPGVPIMKSRDLVHWKIVSYASSNLGDIDAMNLTNGKSTYGKGSWASCLRYHNGTFYITTFSQTTNKTYIYSTQNIEKGQWKEISFQPAYHDHTLFFDDDGRTYLIYGNGKLYIVELNDDLNGVKPETNHVLIENASSPAGQNIALGAEGSQLFKFNGKYYLFNITWPRGGMRTELVHRADKITGPYEGKIVFQDMGIAQGGIIETSSGKWYSYLFRDYGSVGRIPYLIPMKWESGWPVIGVNGKVPDQSDLPDTKEQMPGIVANDEFLRKKGEPLLPLEWQWNHNPDNRLWSLTAHKGYLRFKTDRIDSLFVLSRNTLTQRTFGPVCSGITSLDVTNMREGDFAGLCVLQRKFGQVGVRIINGEKYISMVSNETEHPVEMQRIPLNKNTIFLRIDCNFTDKTDIARFFYSTDERNWIPIGGTLKMEYTLMEHFMGYRFGLFNFSTKLPGGFADFDYFHISNKILQQ